MAEMTLMSALTRNRGETLLLSAAVAGVLLAGGPPILAGHPSPGPRADTTAVRSEPDTVRTAVLQRWPPYYRWPEGGEPDGFAVESFRAIAESASLTPEFRRFPDFPTVFEAFRRGEVDVIPNLGQIAGREEWAAFTGPVQTFPVVVFTRESGPVMDDLSDVSGRTVGVVRENVGVQLLADWPSVAREVYPGIESALFGLIAGEVDAVLYPRPVLLALARSIGAEDGIRASDTPLLEVKRAIAVRPDRPELHARLASAVKDYVGSAAYEHAYRRWFGHPGPFWTVERVAWSAGGGLLLAIILAAGWRYLALRRLNRKLRESEQRFRQLAENIEEVFWLRDPEGKQILYVSPMYEEIWDRSVEELYRRPSSWLEAVHPEDRDRVHAAALEGPDPGFKETYRIVRPDGEVRWIEDEAFPIRDEDGEIYRAAGVARDVTESKRMEEDLRWMALHDPLTGLPNRTLLEDRIEQALARSHRRSEPIALLMLDIDGFKRVNDSLGHTAGDRVLKEVGHRLQHSVREEDTVARWGGDEFCVVLPGASEPEAVREAWERLRVAVRPSIEVDGEPVYLNLTGGAAVHSDQDRRETVQAGNPEELIRFVNLALHWAKEKAPGGFSLFDPVEQVDEATHIQREDRLRNALERKEIVPYYQPIVRLDDRTRESVEVLARWRHPEEGILGPGAFIPLAEELGLIVPLQEAIIRQGCRDLVAREEAGEAETSLKVRFNVSGLQFRDPDLVEDLDQVVREVGARPEQVIIEVTETSLMEEPATVDALQDAGFEVSIDDFGTGYSTLTYLRDLDVDEIKIDMTFVQGIIGSPSDTALADTILTLGEKLGLRVVAEGIETEGQLQKLQALGCVFGQGYLFGRPGPLGEIEGS